MFQAIMLVVGVYYLLRLVTLGSAGVNVGMPPEVLQQWRGQKRRQYIWGIVAGWGSFVFGLILLSTTFNICQQNVYNCTSAQALEVTVMVFVMTLPVLLGGVLLSDRARRKAKTLQRGTSASVQPGWPQPGWPQPGAYPSAPAQPGWPQPGAYPSAPAQPGWPQPGAYPSAPAQPGWPQPGAYPPAPAQPGWPQPGAYPPAQGASRSRKPVLVGLLAIGLVAVVAAGALVVVVGGSHSDPVIPVPANYAAAFQSGAPDGDYSFYALKDKVPDWNSVAAAGIFICSVTRPTLIPQTERGELDSGAFHAGTVMEFKTSDIANSLGIKQLVVTVPAAVKGCTEVAVKRMSDTPGMLLLTDAKASFAEQAQVVKVLLKSDDGATSGPSSVATQAANNGGDSGNDLTGAAASFANIRSYKFSMTLAGGVFSGMTSTLGAGAGSSSVGGVTVSGTVVTSPEKADDITFMGLHFIEVGGYSYLDLSATGVGSAWSKSTLSGGGIADAYSPPVMFSAYAGIDLSSYKLVGSENKNGVDANHYQADASALGDYGFAYGVTGDATWSGDIWVAKDGGFPVSVNILAKDSANKVAFQMSYDLFNINDSSLKVTAPPT